jgi:uncharacterized protein YdeI (YjbR/CyaY-like superfamily)
VKTGRARGSDLPGKPTKPRFFANASAFRRWLDANHATASELTIGFYKKHTGRSSLGYKEAVDEALTLGWIDGITRRIDEDRYAIRFTPRRPRSRWSQINIRRVGELNALGRMKPAGVAAFNARVATSQPYSYETRPRQFPVGLRRRFKANPAAWAFFESQPPGYRRTCIWWVVSARKPETRESRLSQLIEYSGRGKRLPGA